MTNRVLRGWSFYAITLAVLAIVVALREGTRNDSVTEVLVEREEIIRYRVYFDTAQGDRFFLYANGVGCEISEDEYMRTYVGQQHTCLWKAF